MKNTKKHIIKNATRTNKVHSTKTVQVYSTNGEVLGEKKLPADLFSCLVNETLVHQVVVAQQANKRAAIAHTKGRSDVRGGGKKPWRQKGTGRARHGSIRSPIWKGGGVTFGPTNKRNFSKKINSKMAKKALCMALSDRADGTHIVLIDNFDLHQTKTKNFTECVSKLPNKNKRTLLLLAKNEKNVKRIAGNVPKIEAYKADSVQALNVTSHPFLMMSKNGLDELVKTFSTNNAVKK